MNCKDRLDVCFEIFKDAQRRMAELGGSMVVCTREGGEQCVWFCVEQDDNSKVFTYGGLYGKKALDKKLLDESKIGAADKPAVAPKASVV